MNNYQNVKSSFSAERKWFPTINHPYPMNFVQEPSTRCQLIICYNGEANLQGLSAFKSPTIFTNKHTGNEERPKIDTHISHTMMNHSTPGPYILSYYALPYKIYAY
jgi:hypothetical protein